MNAQTPDRLRARIHELTVKASECAGRKGLNPDDDAAMDAAIAVYRSLADAARAQLAAL